MFASDHWHSEFSFRTLGRRLASMPLVVLLLPFILGIVLAERYVVPMSYALVLSVVLLALLWAMARRRVVWLYGFVLLVVLGYVVAELRVPRATTPIGEEVVMTIDVESEPLLRDGYSLADGRVIEWLDEEGVAHSADDRVRLWVECDGVSVGDRIVVGARLRESISRYIDYDLLLHRRGFVGGVWLDDYSIVSLEHSEPKGLHRRAVDKLRRYAKDSASYATVEAMVAGSRRMMSDELSEAYSRTGLSHLMAVSGLHLGIVAMVVTFVLLPLTLLHRGHRLANLLTIVVLWLFAIMSGLSPSVVRAAIMFSVLLIAAATSLRYNVLNSLAATVLLMLVYNPNYLWDVSFQLSVAAVFGIVAWVMPLRQRVGLRRGVVGWLFSSVVVGVVASFWTLPIISYNFGNIPLLGILLTPFAIVTTSLIIGCGLFALLLPDALAQYAEQLAEWSAALQNWAVERVADLSWVSVEYTLSEWGVALCYLLFAIITLVGWSINRKKVITLSEYDEYSRYRTSKER